MKEIGQKLKDAREEIGVSIEEVAEDLKLRPAQIENIENGDSSVFKDMFNLKYLIRDYSKYLGLNKEDLVDEYNEYLFDYTSKISLEDIKKAKKERGEAKRIKSPYTTEKKSKKKYIIMFLYFAIIILIILITLLIINFRKSDSDDFTEGSVVTDRKWWFMNLPNKLTMVRIFLTLVVIFILLFPFSAMRIDIPQIFVNEALRMDIRYPIAGVIFIIASITDFFDGIIARKYNLITDFGKMIDAIADKILVNSVLIILSAQGFIHPIIPVIIVLRDTVIDSIKMVAGSKGKVVAAIKSGKYKTASLMIGIVLTLFYDMPFELWNVHVSDFLLIVACVLSIVSGVQYYSMNKKYIFGENGEI